MKKRLIAPHIIPCFVWILLLSSQCEKRREYTLDLINNSVHKIGYYFAMCEQYGTCYPDTLLPITNDIVVYDMSKEIASGILTRRSWDKVFSTFPKDTMSVFIFHTDTLNKYTWKEVKDKYMILKRYDLSLDDLQRLHNKYGTPEIPYPPDERMKDMKMYPLYGSENADTLALNKNSSLRRTSDDIAPVEMRANRRAEKYFRRKHNVDWDYLGNPLFRKFPLYYP